MWSEKKAMKKNKKTIILRVIFIMCGAIKFQNVAFFSKSGLKMAMHFFNLNNYATIIKSFFERLFLPLFTKNAQQKGAATNNLLQSCFKKGFK